MNIPHPEVVVKTSARLASVPTTFYDLALSPCLSQFIVVLVLSLEVTSDSIYLCSASPVNADHPLAFLISLFSVHCFDTRLLAFQTTLRSWNVCVDLLSPPLAPECIVSFTHTREENTTSLPCALAYQCRGMPASVQNLCSLCSVSGKTCVPLRHP